MGLFAARVFGLGGFLLVSAKNHVIFLRTRFLQRHNDHFK